MKELREDRRPADLWFWSDWLSSIDVRSCSLAAQGLWANMLAVMSRSDRKGFLSINGKPMDSKELAKFVGEFKDKVEELLQELEYYNVFSRDSDGTIYNRRMARESELSRKRSEAGRLGGIQAKAKQIESKDGSKALSKTEATLEDEDEDEDEREDKRGERGETVAGTASKIVSYLNEKTGKRFNPKSSDTVKHIGARLNEGRTIDDFKRVIDTKVAKWHGKTWADTRPGREGQTVHGDDFLCPSTLFCAKNFENYLNETPAATKMTPDEWRKQQAAELEKLRGGA